MTEETSNPGLELEKDECSSPSNLSSNNKILEGIRMKILKSDINQYISVSNVLNNNFCSNNSILSKNQDSVNSSAEAVQDNFFANHDSSSNESQQLLSNSGISETHNDNSERENNGSEQLETLLINDNELTNLSVPDFNRRICNFPLDIQNKLRKRRRTLKNRRYASHCRRRRQKHKEALESSNKKLESEIHRCKLDLLQVMNEVAELHKNSENILQEIEEIKKENASLIEELSEIGVESPNGKENFD